MPVTDCRTDINKKTGFFSFEDSGLADVHLGFGDDDGLHFRVKLEKAAEKDRQFFFKVVKVEGAQEDDVLPLPA
jgi:hypothetical protein